MWISRYVTGRSLTGETPGIGEVRAAGAKVTVSAAADHAELPIASPYGIIYVPPVGSRSVVLPTEGGSVCLGVIAAHAAQLEQGELMLRSAGGASIVLKNDGSVLINGRAVE